MTAGTNGAKQDRIGARQIGMTRQQFEQGDPGLRTVKSKKIKDEAETHKGATGLQIGSKRVATLWLQAQPRGVESGDHECDAVQVRPDDLTPSQKEYRSESKALYLHDEELLLILDDYVFEFCVTIEDIITHAELLIYLKK